MWFNKIFKNKTLSKKKFFIDKKYQERFEPKYFDDVLFEEKNIVYQPDIYPLAAYLGEKFGCDYIIDVGCGTANKLVQLHPNFKIIGIDFGDNIKRCMEKYDFGTWLNHDLESIKPIEIQRDVLTNSIIICADVIEHLSDPTYLLNNLKMFLDYSSACLISTPGRDLDPTKPQLGPPRNPHHVREWAVKEFANLLKSYNFNTAFLGHMTNNDQDLQKNTILAIIEQNNAEIDFRNPFEKSPSNFKVIAIIPTYNESDMITHTIKHFINEGVDVYLLDNWSSDNTIELAKKFEGKGVIGIEKFPKEGSSQYFSWKMILSRMEELTLELKTDWFILNDADVLKRSPWKGVNLKDAIFAVDRAGYNTIDHTVITFSPIDNSYSTKLDPEKHFRYFEFRKDHGQFLQIKTWKNTGKQISFAVSGGHEVQFKDRVVYPYKFLYKHYPILSQRHGEKKIFQERKPRYDPIEKEKGWHTHYDHLIKSDDFIWSKEQLNYFNEAFYEDFLVELVSGIGIKR